LLPRNYEEYPLGSIPSIRRNTIIAACLDVANLMERSGTGFQAMIESYKNSGGDLQPVISIYPGFLNLRLYDRLYNDDESVITDPEISDTEKIIQILKAYGPKSVKELQSYTKYNSRSLFLTEVINPLIDSGVIYRDGKPKSPTALMKIK
jgi:predicted HTH transcriptional regulator